MTITANLVKELRERTSLGMMECKKALVESQGDIELAIENLRKSGQAKAAKKAGRVAAEGAILAQINNDHAVLVEINSETDFVARDDNFLNFVRQVTQAAATHKITQVADLMGITVNDSTLEEQRQLLVQKIGENIQVRRIAQVSGAVLGSYIHGGKIGVLVALSAGDEALAKDVAMHVAASNPLVVKPEQVAQEVLDKEKEIFAAQAKDSGKPDDIIAKMVMGRVKKFLSEVSLIDQPFVKNPDITVGALVKQAGAEVLSFARFEVGEGIEKEEVDFAAEVMAQVKGNS